MSRVTVTTAATAGLGMLVLLNLVLSWGTRRPDAEVRRDKPPPTAAPLDPTIALQLRSGAWRPWLAPPEPAAAVFAASATQPIVPVANPVEAPPSLVRRMPIEPLAHAIVPPSPVPQAPEAGAPPAAPPADTPPAVLRPPLSKNRMLLAGPDADQAIPAHIEHDQPSARSTAPHAEPPGNSSIPAPIAGVPLAGFGPDSFKRIERNGF
jgi:hypothetical protein